MYRRVSDPTVATLTDAATLSAISELAAFERPMWDERTAGIPAWHPRNDGSTTLEPDVRELNQRISTVREEAATAWTAFDEAREKIAGTDAAKDPESPEFLDAEAKSTAYNQAADKLVGLQDARERLLGMTVNGGRHGDAGNGPEDGAARGRSLQLPGAMSAGAIALASEGYQRLKATNAFTQNGRKSIDEVLIAAGNIDDPNDQTFQQARDALMRGLRGDEGGMFATLVTGADDTSGGALVVPQRLPGITVPMRFRPLRLLDLITVGQTDSDTVEYVEMTGFTNNAAETAEATAASGSSGTKPESALALIERTANVRTIAHWIPATKRALADAGQLRTLIDGILQLGLDLRLDQQIVSGSGSGENLRGIRNTVGIGAVNRVEAATGNTNTPETILDAVHRAITIVRLAFFEPTAVGIHPSDWERIRLARSMVPAVANQAGTAGSYATGDYLMGDPSQAGSERIWGLLPVISPAFAEGHPVIGDYRQAVLWLRQGTQVLASDSHMDFFIRNLVAILAEFRAAFGVLAPPAFCEVDIS